MRILRLTPHFYFPKHVAPRWDVYMDPIGGMQTQIHRLATALARRGVRQTVLTMGLRRAPRRWSLSASTEVVATNLPVLPIRSRVRGTVGLNVYWGLGTALWILGHRLRGGWRGQRVAYDRIHCHCSGVPTPLVLGVVAKALLRLPLVYTVHCCRLSTYEPMNLLDRLIHRAAVRVEELCLSRADVVIVLTNRTRRRLQEAYKRLAGRSIHVVPDFISFAGARASVSETAGEAFRRAHGIPAGKRLILYVGRIAHEKGWPYFVAAAESLPREDVHFVVCGDGNERRSMERMVHERGLAARFTITGFVDNQIALNAIATAEMVVVPSLHEEFGSLTLEVASLHKPLVATAVGGLTENLRDGANALLVAARDPAALAEKMAFLLEHPERGRELGAALHRDLQSRFDEDVVIEQVMDTCRGDAERSRGAGGSAQQGPRA